MQHLESKILGLKHYIEHKVVEHDAAIKNLKVLSTIDHTETKTSISGPPRHAPLSTPVVQPCTTVRNGSREKLKRLESLSATSLEGVVSERTRNILSSLRDNRTATLSRQNSFAVDRVFHSFVEEDLSIVKKYLKNKSADCNLNGVNKNNDNSRLQCRNQQNNEAGSKDNYQIQKKPRRGLSRRKSSMCLSFEKMETIGSESNSFLDLKPGSLHTSNSNGSVSNSQERGINCLSMEKSREESIENNSAFDQQHPRQSPSSFYQVQPPRDISMCDSEGDSSSLS